MKVNVVASKRKTTLNLLCAFIVSLNLCGCNTMEGLGSDIKETGEALEQSVERNKDKSVQYCPYCCAPLKQGGCYDKS